MPLLTSQIDMPVGELAATVSGASSIFYRLGIDYCCAGRRTLADACAQAGVAPATVVDELERAREVRAGTGAEIDSATAWAERPLSEIIDHLLAHHHQPLRDELVRLLALARKVADVHRRHAPQLVALAELLAVFADETVCHLEKEERVLFPWILSGRGASAAAPVMQLQREHSGQGEHLTELRRLGEGYQPPAGACPSWRALYLGLGDLERSMKEHIHLENNILFPRALAG